MANLPERNLVLLGAGKMGLSIVRGLLGKGFAKNSLRISCTSGEKAARLSKELGVTASSEFNCEPNDAILIAVKPFQFESLLASIGNRISEGNLVISVMAGIPLARLSNLCRGAEYIRAMPNTPSMLNQGMTVFCGDSNTKEGSYEFCERVFSAVGKILRVGNEEMIDAATAVSGSGPAYVFYLAESMLEAAKQMGFSEKEAKLLINQTLLGASFLMSESEEGPAVLRKNVTSPNGTTAAACAFFDQEKMSKTIQTGCQKALLRAKEISAEN